MAEDELAEFLAQAPTGAICVVDADGQLLALPARVVDFDSATIAVTVEVRTAMPGNPLRSRPAWWPTPSPPIGIFAVRSCREQ
jgi:hypothetical protein